MLIWCASYVRCHETDGTFRLELVVHISAKEPARGAETSAELFGSLPACAARVGERHMRAPIGVFKKSQMGPICHGLDLCRGVVHASVATLGIVDSAIDV